MTKTLQRAVRKASTLPSREQEAFGRWMLKALKELEELEDDERWERSFRRSRGKLKLLAQAALADHKAGRTRRLDPDRL